MIVPITKPINVPIGFIVDVAASLISVRCDPIKNIVKMNKCRFYDLVIAFNDVFDGGIFASEFHELASALTDIFQCIF